MSNADQHLTILLDIKQEIGALNARMTEASHSRQRLEEKQALLVQEMQTIKPVIVAVADLTPQVSELMAFKMKVGAYLVVGSAIVSGALFLIWQGLSYFSTEIKAKLFH